MRLKPPLGRLLRRAASVVAPCGVLLLTAGQARAQGAAARATAVQLFDEADQLMSAGRISEACPKYATSIKLDPQLGALLHLADCYAKNGQLASAWGSFRDAEEIARNRGDERAALARERAGSLEPRLSRMTLSVATEAHLPGLEIRVDGNLAPPATWGIAVLMDPGVHNVDARAPGYAGWSTTVAIAGDAQSLNVAIPRLKSDAAMAAGPAPVPASDARPAKAKAPSVSTALGDGGVPKRTSRLRPPVLIAGGATLLLGAGAVATGGVYLFQRAEFDKVNDAQHSTSLKTNAREAAANMGVVSTVLLVGAAGGAVVSAILFFGGKTSDQQSNGSAQLIPWLTAGGGGLGLEGSL